MWNVDWYVLLLPKYKAPSCALAWTKWRLIMWGQLVGGLMIGFAITADILMGGQLTGAAMNPARWLAPAAETMMRGAR